MRMMRLGEATPGSALWQYEQAQAYVQEQQDQAKRMESMASQYRMVRNQQSQFLRNLDAGAAERNIDPGTGRLLPVLQRQLIPGISNQNAMIGGGAIVLLVVAVAMRRRKRR